MTICPGRLGRSGKAFGARLAAGGAVAQGSFGTDSDAGRRFAERLLTVVATCRQQGRPLLDFLHHP
jgi:hypothetical protein